jgi:hypothetical protein
MQPRTAIADMYFPPCEHIYIMILKGGYVKKEREEACSWWLVGYGNRERVRRREGKKDGREEDANCRKYGSLFSLTLLLAYMSIKF